ncbi:MAG: hypothetical protein HWN66_06560 [Candidatus Helarchaeota archaeon]|nr:hypothetical protein [Candidatus Helarchaeota archaeon]
MSQMEIICKSCGHKWDQENRGSINMYYCPKCGTIGHVDREFEVIYT